MKISNYQSRIVYCDFPCFNLNSQITLGSIHKTSAKPSKISLKKILEAEESMCDLNLQKSLSSKHLGTTKCQTKRSQQVFTEPKGKISLVDWQNESTLQKIKLINKHRNNTRIGFYGS